MAKKKPDLSNYDALLTHREVAKMMGVHPMTVHRWMQEGTIPSEAILRLPGGARSTSGLEGVPPRGNSVRFRKSHIEKLMQTRQEHFDRGGEEGSQS